MNINVWKLTAIIFIILFILQTITFSWLLIVGVNVIGNENKCSSICYDKNYDSFQFIEDTCYCFVNGEKVYSEVLK